MDIDNIAAVIDAARASERPHTFIETATSALVFLPRGGPDGTQKLERVSIEIGMAKPARKRGTIEVFDAASFNQVLRDNADAGDIAVYLDRNPAAPSIVAVLNGHGQKGAGWGDFRARITFRQTPQWVKWQAIDGKLLPQASFAEFIEDNIEDIADPAGATMLEIATYLQATREVAFKSGIRLSSGAVQLQNLENVQAQVGAGQIAVPEKLTLGIAPIFGVPPYSIPARFRWRIAEGKLMLGVKLQRVEDMMRQIIEDVAAKIERGAGIAILDGIAPEPVKAV